jgi:hypothetical protein
MPKIKLPKVTKVVDFPLVEIIWVDAAIDIDASGDLNDSISVNEFGGRILCHDVGYIVRRNSGELVLAVSISPEDNTFRHANTIPFRWIREIHNLRTGEVETVAKEKKHATKPSI